MEKYPSCTGLLDFICQSSEMPAVWQLQICLQEESPVGKSLSDKSWGPPSTPAIHQERSGKDMWRAEDPRALEPAAFWRKLKWEGPSPRAGIRPPKTFSFLLLPPVLGNRGSPKGVERGSQSELISYMVSLSLEVFKTQLYNTMTRSHVVMRPTSSRSLA